MALEILKTANKVIGIKQVTKAVNKGMASQVFLATNADARVLEPLKALCRDRGIDVLEVPTMLELGQACGIEVGSAAAAALK